MSASHLREHEQTSDSSFRTGGGDFARQKRSLLQHFTGEWNKFILRVQEITQSAVLA